MRTDPVDWTCLQDGDTGRWIDPVPYTGEHEDFIPNITDDMVDQFKDANGDIRYDKVLEWTLPRFGDDDELNLWEWQAARMRNYMTYLIKHRSFKPRYYNPTEGIVITADHVCRFYGCTLARAQTGNNSINEIWSTRNVLKSVASIKESMPQASRCIP